MAVGNYSFTASYEGNDNFSKASAKGEFKVIDTLLNAKLEYKTLKNTIKQTNNL